MKKFFAIAIVAIMMLGLVSCGANAHQVGDLSIDLPITYVDASDVISKIVGEDVLNSSEVEMHPYISLVDGMAVIITRNPGNGTSFEDDIFDDYEGAEYETYRTLEVNGHLAMETTQNIGGTNLKILVVYYGDEENAYLVAFVCKEGEYDKKQEKMIKYASTVVIEE